MASDGRGDIGHGPAGYVIDTSVLVRWFLQQSGWRHAQHFRDQFLSGSIELQSTECARFELPHVLRTKGLLARKLTVDDYRAAVRVVDDFGIHVEPLTVDTLEACAMLALTRNLRFFDAVFLHRSLITGWPLLTADRALGAVATGAAVEVQLVADE